MKIRKIMWKREITGSFGSQSLVGKVGKIGVFSINWSVTLKEHKELPYVLHSYLMSLKKRRFKTEEEAKKYAIKGFYQIVSELVEN